MFSISMQVMEVKRPAQILVLKENSAGGGSQYLLHRRYYASRADHSEGGDVVFFDGHVKWLRVGRGHIGHDYSHKPHNSSYEVHPPAETFYDRFGTSNL